MSTFLAQVIGKDGNDPEAEKNPKIKDSRIAKSTFVTVNAKSKDEVPKKVETYMKDYKPKWYDITVIVFDHIS